MAKQVAYTFEAYGQTRTISVRENDFGVVYEKGDAMAKANTEFLNEMPEFQEDPYGTWIDLDRYTFIWVPDMFIWVPDTLLD